MTSPTLPQTNEQSNNELVLAYYSEGASDAVEVRQCTDFQMGPELPCQRDNISIVNLARDFRASSNSNYFH
jgi:hypothetical protein